MPFSRQRVGSLCLPSLAEPLRDGGLQRLVPGSRLQEGQGHGGEIGPTVIENLGVGSLSARDVTGITPQVNNASVVLAPPTADHGFLVRESIREAQPRTEFSPFLRRPLPERR